MASTPKSEKACCSPSSESKSDVTNSSTSDASSTTSTTPKETTNLASVRLERFLADGPCSQVAIATWCVNDAAQSGSQVSPPANISPGIEASSLVDGDTDTVEEQVEGDDDAGDYSLIDCLPKSRSDELLQQYGLHLHLPVAAGVPAGEQTTTPFALKIIKLRDVAAGTNKQPQSLFSEIEIIRRLSRDENKSPFFIDFIFSALVDDRIFLGMELCTGGDLFTLMYEHELNLEEVLFVAAEIAAAIDHLHQRNIIHGDLKPENIGLTAQGHVRLLDFGLATHLNQDEHWDPQAKRLCVLSASGTLCYSAPEILKRDKHGLEIDWWSFAVIVYEMYYACWPWYAEVDQDTCNLICAAPLEFPHDSRPFVPELNNFFHQLFRKDPTRRLCYDAGLEDIKAHPLFKFVDWDLLTSEGYEAPPSLRRDH